jgi:hypothetical protein
VWPSLEAKLMSMVVKEGSGCWRFTGSISPDGYGRLGWDRRNIAAHRASWEVFRGPIRWGKCICHHCDRRWCVNPDHLFEGNEQDNSNDMVRKGRQLVGQQVPSSKLTNSNIREIRRLLAEGRLNQREIAELFGVGHGLISKIKLGEVWSHVPAYGLWWRRKLGER